MKEGVSEEEVNYKEERKKDQDVCCHEVVIDRFRWWWGAVPPIAGVALSPSHCCHCSWLRS